MCLARSLFRSLVDVIISLHSGDVREKENEWSQSGMKLSLSSFKTCEKKSTGKAQSKSNQLSPISLTSLLSSSFSATLPLYILSRKSQSFRQMRKLWLLLFSHVLTNFFLTSTFHSFPRNFSVCWILQVDELSWLNERTLGMKKGRKRWIIIRNWRHWGRLKDDDDDGYDVCVYIPPLL